MNNISKIQKDRCTGCSACVAVCPKKCITMLEDEEYFKYPKVDFENCINCGICTKKCPAINTVDLYNNKKAYAATGKNKTEVDKSSSGGAFILCARYVIEELNGYVCGAVLYDNLELKHELVNTMDGAKKMQGSKYIQSDIGDCFERIIELLKLGVYVLFCGTPCQVAGLKKIVKCGSDHLFTLDLICHGVPSAIAFSKYMKKKYNQAEFNDFTFRQRNKYLLTSFSYSFLDNKNKKKYDDKHIMIEAYEDPFYQSFLDGKNYRESCYKCNYAKSNRCGDITIGDCANSNSYKSLLGKSLSSIIVNTKQGEILWDNVKEYFEYVDADYERETKLNKQLHKPVERPDSRDEFYRDLKVMSNNDFYKKYSLKLGLKGRIKHFIIWHIPVKTRIKLKKFLGKTNEKKYKKTR